MRVKSNKWYYLAMTHTIQHKKWWEFWKSDSCEVQLYLNSARLSSKQKKSIRGKKK